MASYKRDAGANRDALFGGAGGGGSTKSGARKPAPRAPAPSQPSRAPPRSPPTNANDPEYTHTPGPSKIFGGKASTAARNNLISTLTGQAKIDKMAEAEDYRLKAQKAMTRGVFSRPDPISAGNYYKRAADAYKACGENRLERLHRIASGDVQLGQDAYAIAAQEYVRAAELSEVSDETLARKKQEMHKLYCDAGDAWAQMGEKGRAAECRMKAAFGLMMGDEVNKSIEANALASIENAIESFVPDPLNRKRNYRKGPSMYENPNAVDVEADRREALELAKQNIINDAFAHECLFKVGAELIKRRHYETALYAYGAGTASLESEGIATVSLGRAYLSETVLTLAMGDTVAASQDFQRVHLQNTAYLSSRECALAEDLIRACAAMDLEALDETRSKSGSHRSAMANLEPVLRHLVGEIRVSGRAKKSSESKPKVPQSSSVPKVEVKATAAAPTQPAVAKTGDDLLSEMDDIMNEMGLNDDGEDEDDVDLT
jgi:tetratricopeptide (TPR) repeat protein